MTILFKKNNKKLFHGVKRKAANTPFLLSGVNTGHLTAVLTVGL